MMIIANINADGSRFAAIVTATSVDAIDFTTAMHRIALLHRLAFPLHIAVRYGNKPTDYCKYYTLAL